MSNMLASLEVELLSAILEYVDDSSPKTTKSVARVNKHFYATAKRVICRRRILDMTELDASESSDRDTGTPSLDHEQLIASWLANSEALRSIRHLTITGAPIYYHERAPGGSSTQYSEDSSTWTSAARLVQNIGKLRSLTWTYKGPVPLAILDALHLYQPKAELKVYHFARLADDLDHTDPAETALSNSPALTVFRAVIWQSETGTDLREATCQRIIANAPNLKFASVTTGASGHIPSPEEEAELAEKAGLLHTHKRPNDSIRTLTLDGYRLSKDTLDHWGKFLDFSKLEALKCSRGCVPDESYFSHASGLFTSLKHVSLNFANHATPTIAAAADDYLSTCPTLETLSLWSWKKIVPLSSILRHGPTLRTLQLHERESTHLKVARGLLSLEDVRAIRQSCPLLRDLTMDVDREAESWEGEKQNRKIYEELALFGPQLDKIQIYFNLGIAAVIVGEVYPSRIPNRHLDLDSDSSNEVDNNSEPVTKRLKEERDYVQERSQLPLPNPEDTHVWLKNIWKTIFGQRIMGDRALDVKIGEWERKRGPGYFSGWIRWEAQNRSWVKLRPNERDDMRDDVVVSCEGRLATVVERFC